MRENVTTHQYVVMRGLDELGDTIQRTLAEYCAIEPSNLNVMIKRMKANGLVEAGRAAGNGSRETIKLSAAGRRVVRRLWKIEVEVTDAFLSPLTPAESKSLHSALKKVIG